MRVRTRLWGLAVAVGIALLGAPQAKATPLNLILQPEPDINYAFASVTYTAATDVLTISGFATNMDAFNVVNQAIAGGTFNLSANVDGSGNLVSGSFTVGGTVAAFGYNSGTLLTGTLTAIGFPDGVQGALEFLFNATGGDAAGLYGNFGAITVGIVNGFPGDWDSDFSASFSAPGDVATVVPEPGSFALLAVGLAGLAWQRRRSG